MPVKEREKLFAVIARHGFEKELYTHEDVFGELNEKPFTIKEAAEYLEVAEITVRRWVKGGTLKAKQIGRSLVFEITALKEFKRLKGASDS